MVDQPLYNFDSISFKEMVDSMRHCKSDVNRLSAELDILLGLKRAFTLSEVSYLQSRVTDAYRMLLSTMAILSNAVSIMSNELNTKIQ